MTGEATLVCIHNQSLEAHTNEYRLVGKGQPMFPHSLRHLNT